MTILDQQTENISEIMDAIKNDILDTIFSQQEKNSLSEDFEKFSLQTQNSNDIDDFFHPKFAQFIWCKEINPNGN